MIHESGERGLFLNWGQITRHSINRLNSRKLIHSMFRQLLCIGLCTLTIPRLWREGPEASATNIKSRTKLTVCQCFVNLYKNYHLLINRKVRNKSRKINKLFPRASEHMRVVQCKCRASAADVSVRYIKAGACSVSGLHVAQGTDATMHTSYVRLAGCWIINKYHAIIRCRFRRSNSSWLK